MDIAEIRKKAKLLKTKLKDMEGSLRRDTLEGRVALEKLKGKNEVPIETTPEAQRESKFKMADALEMNKAEADVEVRDVVVDEKPKEALVEETIEENSEFGGLTEAEQKEFEELQKQAELEESGEATGGSGEEKQSERLLDKLVTESVEAEIKIEKEAEEGLVMPDLLDIDDVLEGSQADGEEVDLSAFGDEEISDSSVEEKIEEPEKKVKKSRGKKKEEVSKDDLLPQDSLSDDLESETPEGDEIEWGSDEDLDEVIDFEVEALIFSLGQEKYGIDIQLLSEVIKSTDLIDIPRAPRGTHGVLSLRGHIIPVMDLKERIGLDSESTRNRILILKDDEGFVGLYVDSVDDVIGFTKEDLQPAPSVTSIDSTFIQNLGRVEDKPYIILDMQTILEKI